MLAAASPFVVFLELAFPAMLLIVVPLIEVYERRSLQAANDDHTMATSGKQVPSVASPREIEIRRDASGKLLRTTFLIAALLHAGIALGMNGATVLSGAAIIAWLPVVPFSESGKRATIPFSCSPGAGEAKGIRNNTKEELPSEGRNASSWSSHAGSVLFLLALAASLHFEVGGAMQCTSAKVDTVASLLHNRWNVFAGTDTEVVWQIMPGLLEDGSVVDVWRRGAAVNWDVPKAATTTTTTTTNDEVEARGSPPYESSVHSLLSPVWQNLSSFLSFSFTFENSRHGRWRSFPLASRDDATEEELEEIYSWFCKEWNEGYDTGGNFGSSDPRRRLVRFRAYLLQAPLQIDSNKTYGKRNHEEGANFSPEQQLPVSKRLLRTQVCSK